MLLREENFRAILLELIDENSFAVRPILKILGITFTESVNTLSITCESRPLLKVNLSFMNKHCHTDKHVKALIYHEFLHVLLSHTEKTHFATRLHNVAFDTVINAIIHRTLGEEYSSMMSLYYKSAKWPLCLLRPRRHREFQDIENVKKKTLWDGLYEGKLIADDISDILKDISEASKSIKISLDDLFGNHSEGCNDIGKEIAEALRESLRQMNGSGIWRNPGLRGVGADAYRKDYVAQKHGEMQAWKRKAMSVLRNCLIPNRRSRLRDDVALEFRLPLMNEHDKRAFLRGLWSPFIPDSTWETSIKKPGGMANIYLDMSGSMNHEMPHLVALLVRLRSYISMPFWAFSDIVARAVIKNGRLESDTTGGTSMNCVLEHIAKTKPISAVIITDGYIGDVDRLLLARVIGTKLHAIVTRDGDPSKLDKVGIHYTQLDRIPS